MYVTNINIFLQMIKNYSENKTELCEIRFFEQ